MEKINIKFRLTASDYDKQLQFHLGESVVLQVFKPYDIDYSMSFSQGVQTLDFIMSNKTDADSTLTISDVQLDDILLGHAFFSNTLYHHNFNGYGKHTVEQFHGTMGCNGVAKFSFTTPLYQWLIANN